MTHAEVTVVGGGIAGLACATELADQGREVLLLESAPRVGGPAETRRIGELLIERGPNTVRATPELVGLIRRAGLSVQEARRGSPYLVSNGRLLRLPPSPRDLARGDPLPPRAWLELLGEPFRPRVAGPCSVRDFVRRRLGPTVAERLADVMTLGVFGAPAERIGFESAFPELAQRLQGHRSLLSAGLAAALRRRVTPRSGGLISTPEGLGAIPGRLAARLGDRVRVDTPVRHVTPRNSSFEIHAGERGEARIVSRQVVLAIPPAAALRLLDDSPVRRMLSSYRATPQALATFALDDPGAAARWAGFGFLAPTRERLPLVGCLFPSSLFAGRAPEGTLLLVVFVGPTLVDAPDATLAREIAAILERLLEAPHPPRLVDVARHPAGITLCDRRHRDRTRVLRRRLEALRGLRVAGAAYDGVAFGKAAASGIRAARELLREP